MLISSLAKKGFFWSFIETIYKRGIHFFIGIILARLLTPSDYGLIGICSIVIALGSVFVEGGFGIALIRKKKCSEKDYSTVFIFNLVISSIFYLLIYFSSPIISQFFKNSELINLIRVLSLVIVFGAFSMIPKTILTKDVNFKSQSKVVGISMLISGLLGIILAYRGFGVWSLVIQALSLSFLSAILYWRASSWRPKLMFSKTSFKELFAFGSNLLIIDIINLIYKNSYYIIIGKYFSSAYLGFFTRADTTVNLITNNVTNTIKRASYPILAKLQDDEVALKKMYRKIVKNTYLIFSSLILGLAATSESFIYILIGEQWLPSVTYIQLLCFASFFMPLTIFNLNAINVKGHSKLYLKLQLTNKLMGVPAIFLGIYFGIEEMIVGFILVSFAYYLINNYYSSKLIKYSLKEQFYDLFPIFSVSILVSLIVYQLNQLNIEYHFMFIIQLTLAVLLTFIMYNIIQFQEFLEIQKKIYLKIKNIWSK